MLISLTISSQQTYLDSRIGLKETNLIEGIIPGHVTPGYEAIAISMQSIITDAKHYYDGIYKDIDAKVKLAILDSLNWTYEDCPYGYAYAHLGWIVMPGDIDFNDFVRIYGALSFRKELLEESLKYGIKPDEIVESYFQFVAIHELGHLIVDQMIKEGPPGDFLNEIIANVISYKFFKNNRPELWRGWELFYNVNLNNYNPYFKTLNEFNDNYLTMSIDNYIWYHCNFMKLVEDIYNKKDVDFLLCLKKLCEKNDIKALGIYEIATMLDKDYNDIFTKWLDKNN